MRFLIGFVGLLVLFEFLMYAVIAPSSWFHAYLVGSSRVAGAVLRAIGVDVVVHGNRIVSSEHSIEVLRGCDGLQPMAVLVCGVLAFPSRALDKLIGIGAGVALILVANVGRIASLFVIGAQAPESFRAAHLYVWPSVLIAVAVTLWYIWLRRCVLAPERGAAP